MLRLDINIGSTSFANLFNVIDYHTMFSFLIRLINLLFKTREKRNKKKIASNKLIMSDLKPINVQNVLLLQNLHIVPPIPPLLHGDGVSRQFYSHCNAILFLSGRITLKAVNFFFTL